MSNLIKTLGAEIRCLFTRKFYPIAQPRVLFHSSSMLSARKYSDSFDCPDTKTTECKPLKKRPCSPTDSPVRPCSEQDCEEKPRKSCCVNTRLSKDVCQELDEKETNEVHQWVSMWEGMPKSSTTKTTSMWDYPPECCPKCDDVRFDILYYRPSNKFRKYQRTWWECCPRMVPKRVCCYCDAIPPERSQRCLPICSRSACTSEDEKKRLDCINKKSKNCMRISMPCCRSARVPPVCDVARHPTLCEKPKCPYPSYSECHQEDPGFVPERPPECRCLNMMPKCDAIRKEAKMSAEALRLCPCPKC